MGTPRPLPSPEAARSSLAHRFTRRADRIRQLNTRFGLRSRRVFLVWTRWTGKERGAGDEHEIARVELLPTPKVSDLTAVGRVPTAHGVWPDGTVFLDQVSAGAYTEDNLVGLRIPDQHAELSAPRATPGALIDGTPAEPRTDPRVDFFYELVEDGRGSPRDGEPQATRKRFRLAATPGRAEGSLYWRLVLARATDDRDRLGTSREGDDDTFLEG